MSAGATESESARVVTSTRLPICSASTSTAVLAGMEMTMTSALVQAFTVIKPSGLWMVMIGWAATLKCCSWRMGPAETALHNKSPGTASTPAVLKRFLNVVLRLRCVGTRYPVLIGRFLRVRRSAPAGLPSAYTPNIDSPALLHSLVPLAHFFHTTKCSCQRWPNFDGAKPL